jgi:outer membrane protein TolC
MQRLVQVLALFGGLVVDGTSCAARLGAQPTAQLQAPQAAPPAVRFLAPQPAPPDGDQPAAMQSAPGIAYSVAVLQDTALPVSLPLTLRLSLTNNYDIAQAREFVTQAGIGLDRARMGFLPTFNIGSAYSHHEGTIQKTEGNIIFANRDSLFVGGGPSLAVSFSDALFAPLVARQLTAGSQAGLVRQQNDTLLNVAEAYFRVLYLRRRLARIAEVLDYLASEQAAQGRAGSKGLLPVVQSVQAAGGAEASRAEVERVRVEVLRRQEEQVATLQDFRVAMAELARLVRLDPRVPLWPVEDFRIALPLPGAPWFETPLEELVRAALGNRPELAENQALIRAAVERVRTARFRPWLPNVVLGYNFGDFGGGPDTNPSTITPATKTSLPKIVAQPGFGSSGRILHFDPRTDFDVAMVWKLQNMGLGDLANVREQQSRVRQAEFVQYQLQDRVVTQVVQANELVQRGRERVVVTRQALFDDTGAAKGPVFVALRLNFDRIRTVPNARPLEVLDAIRGLNDTLEAYGQALTDYERARFRLLVSLGLPPRELIAAPPTE